MDLGINFDFFLIFKFDTQIHTQKLNFFFIILNYLFGNSQEICKILKLKKLKTQTKLKPLSIFGRIFLKKIEIFRPKNFWLSTILNTC
jgi:hypothetical protein